MSNSDLRFSDYFKLGKSQPELDFVDIPLETDIRLFVDPFALNIQKDDWFIEANNLVIDYFQTLVDSIRQKNESKTEFLLNHFHEPNETHLGFSHEKSKGRGFGKTQASYLRRQLVASRAVFTGQLNDLSDCELVIPGISNDKISDMTINIIRGKLIEYTQLQTELFEIPVEEVQSGPFWNQEENNWNNTYVNLPVYKNTKILLVPKRAVRYQMAINHQEYYRDFVLRYLKAEYGDPAKGLTHVLKNGKTVVYKQDLRKKYPCTKKFLFEFSEKHPEILEEYKKHAKTSIRATDDYQIESAQSNPREIAKSFAAQLKTIQPGNLDASKYHNLMTGLLSYVFIKGLSSPQKEKEINEGRKRIDLVFRNNHEGFFGRIKDDNDIKCPLIFVECKNYLTDPANPEIDQLAGRFNPHRGMFGILVCRNFEDRNLFIKRCKDLISKNEFIVGLDDSDINELLSLRDQNKYLGIDEFMENKLNELIL